ncbi:MAG TPA: hypothetical protein VLL75_00160 [Vicinamibacteria bacterium]|nr:hypothetical protein [Vicinamibacteria bacterium]
MRLASGSVVLALLTSPAWAEVAVRVSGGHVDLTATAAPLADVLDRLARQTGMKVVYEGPAPRQLVTVSLHGRTPAETVLAVFEGLGLNYALVADATGDGVQALVVAGASSATAATSSSPAAGRPTVSPGGRRPFGPPPGSSPEPVEPAFDETEDQAEANDLDFTGVQPGAENAEAAGAPQPGAAGPGPASVPAQNPTVPPQGTGPAPTPTTPFSASPFTPQPPHPFPPVPPGAPAGANPPPQAEEGKPQAAPPPPQ